MAITPPATAPVRTMATNPARQHCQSNFKVVPYRGRRTRERFAVMKILRTISTRRLLAIIAGLIVAIGGGTAIAFAANSNRPVPPRESLAQALHQAATAPAPTGIFARIRFTNHLIESSDIQGTDPILTGASGRLWLSPSTHSLRLELQGDNGDAQVVVKNGAFSIYDPMSNVVYRGTLPADTSKTDTTATEPVPSVAQIQAQLGQLMQQLNVAGPTPRNVAGQQAYKVVLSPKHSGGLIGDVQLAWDATHGVPLGIAIYSRGSSSPVLELKATDISFGPVSAKDFKVSAPAGAKVVRISSQAHPAASKLQTKASKAKRAAKTHADVLGRAAVQAHLPFRLAAPNKLVGLPRQSVQLLDWGGSPAALMTYGQGLGGIAVIEQTAPRNGSSQSQGQSRGGGGPQGLSLPTVSIHGATGQELATALGTVLRVPRGGVEYTVIGSVPPTAAEMAAKALVP
jgi:outer membrane lipoprotein-sorting protein